MSDERDTRDSRAKIGDTFLTGPRALVVPESEASEKVGRGGDVRFVPGMGGVNPKNGRPGENGSLVFALPGGQEQLRFDPDGAVWVRGERVTYRKDIYEGFLAWLSTAVAIPIPPKDPIDGQTLVIMSLSSTEQALNLEKKVAARVLAPAPETSE